MANLYFDNAATSFPKPPAVAAEITRYLNDVGGPYGRGAYAQALSVSRVVEECRDVLASKLGIASSQQLVFTHNATHAINMVLHGMNLHNKQVLISPLEHNAVMRPLAACGACYTVLPSQSDGLIDIDKTAQLLDADTALIIVNHQSNINGVIQPVAALKKAAGNVPVLVDAAQSAGHEQILCDEWEVDFLAVTGHKGLLGPTGTGALFIRDQKRLQLTVQGGTGSNSELFTMPQNMPDRFESGTPNIAGIFGLLGALQSTIEPRHSRAQFSAFLDDLKNMACYRVFCAANPARQGMLVSVAHPVKSSSQIARDLSEHYGIALRSGLHCAPLGHRHLKTFPHGTVRISCSPYHTAADLQVLRDALYRIGTT